MSCLRSLAAFVFAIQVVGCSIHPLPEDVTGYDTVQIVSRIRCEVRDGIRGYVLTALERQERSSKFPRYLDLVRGLENGTLKWKDLRDHLRTFSVDSSTVAVFERYNSAAIGYEFSFDATEKNVNGGSLDFLGILSNGAVKLGLSAASDLNRVNTRTFRVVDSFEFLATILPEEYCSPNSYSIHASGSKKNWIYPISGSLGLTELIGTFLNLNQSGNLVSMTESASEVEVPTIVDVMLFTTKFTGGASPSVELTPVGKRFSLTRAQYTTTNERLDAHRLRIVVKLPASEWIPSTIAERRVITAGSLIGIGALPQPRMSKARGAVSLATTMKALVAEQLAVEPTRELIEATIRYRNRASAVLAD
jgi:hypothetical protein